MERISEVELEVVAVSMFATWNSSVRYAVAIVVIVTRDSSGRLGRRVENGHWQTLLSENTDDISSTYFKYTHALINIDPYLPPYLQMNADGVIMT